MNTEPESGAEAAHLSLLAMDTAYSTDQPLAAVKRTIDEATRQVAKQFGQYGRAYLPNIGWLELRIDADGPVCTLSPSPAMVTMLLERHP
jgi:hypothetical protein